jgi:hypothetical protein
LPSKVEPQSVERAKDLGHKIATGVILEVPRDAKQLPLEMTKGDWALYAFAILSVQDCYCAKEIVPQITDMLAGQFCRVATLGTIGYENLSDLFPDVDFDDGLSPKWIILRNGKFVGSTGGPSSLKVEMAKPLIDEILRKE